MKKAITLMIVSLLAVGLAACGKKDESIHVTINVTDANGATESYEVSTVDKTLAEALSSLEATGLTYETKETGDGLILVSVNGQKGSDEQHQYWAVYVNDGISKLGLDKTELRDGAVYDIVYMPDAAGGVEETETESEPATLLGGWQTWDTYNASLTDDEMEVFAKAMEGFTGVLYEPIRVLATQLVSGTNYAFLTQGTAITLEPSIDYYVLTIYSDLDGSAEIKAINKLDLERLQYAEESEPLLGSWVVRNSGKPAMIPDQDVQISFDKAVSDIKDMRYNPIQLLATQIVNGTNYMALCVGSDTGDKPVSNLYILTWYKDLQGNSQITEVRPLNIVYYVNGE